ncbi:LacI family DNA-binding transcriptional regulator [Gallaecimonas pentaromativorans]|uniref:LacI family transcriptional regulator n=1 Tax=Gallaecimonas pentaromativorans TaxID=584787 RepID=A0A3N1NU69_9GAMM|nr:LacI family DNA-binding transcriptional regulator [Gallaecimonas pentaromativorans]MED5526914.1 LacI family DNA-binding transcriptional regulator [Pseudomonadota bacterium]ROQ23384.1 LacI family transcriptional regulator [Gallaecimonas pentaromativorans]
MRNKGKATSFDIAHKAGVSQSTVSRALRGSPLVNKETRDRIQAIARELNYKVDKNASNLRSQHSGTLALLLFEDPTPDDSLINPFFLSMLGSITRACAQAGFDLLVSFQQLSDDWHADYEDSNKADGIILLGYGDYVAYQSKLDQLVAQGTHFVRWGAVLQQQPGLSIGCDNFQGGRDLVRHLLSLGRRRVAFLGHASNHYPEFFERYQGYGAALAEAGLKADPALQLDAITTEQAGYEAVCALLDAGQSFDAVFGASDLIALGAMRALADRGIKVPEQVAVVGFDDIHMAAFANPPLTTVRQNTKLAGEMLVQSLLKTIHKLPAHSAKIPAELVIRRSCGQPGAPSAG